MDYTITVRSSGNEQIVVGEAIAFAESLRGAGQTVALAEVVSGDGSRQDVTPR